MFDILPLKNALNCYKSIIKCILASLKVDQMGLSYIHQMIQLIQKATNSQSNEQRRMAEMTMINLRQQNPEQFFIQIMEIFSSQDTPEALRQVSGTLIAVSVIAKNQTGNFYWDSISGNMKNNIKNANLGILIDPSRGVRRTAANIVSAICFIQLPRNQWEGIVQKICQNVSHQNEVVKQASILTLGFICSRMKQKTDFAFGSSLQDNILSGIILGLQQSEPFIIDTALKALRDSISSLTQTLSNKQYRDYIMKQLIAIINSGKYTIEGLQILGEFVKTCYQFLHQYFEGLAQMLQTPISKSENEDQCIAAMQIWENVANEYKELSEINNNISNYITGAIGQKIVASLLKNLSKMDGDLDNDENPISDSASKALQTIFQNGSTQYKPLVLQFVKVSISQTDWKHRQASIKGFSLLLYGLSDQENEQLISNSINQLMGLLGDNSKQVQFAALDSLTIITEVCGKIILQSQYFIAYLEEILKKLTISEKFLRTGCRIVDNLCEAEKQNGLGKFNGLSDNLINFFLNFALNNQSSLSVVSWSTTTIMNVIQVTKDVNVIKKYIEFIISSFDHLGKISDVEKRQTIASAFFTIIQFCLHGLKDISLQTNIVEAIYTKVTNTFKAKSDVNADGFYAIEALVPFFNCNKAVADDFWMYIAHALTKWQQPGLFRATISCIASFINFYGESIAQKLDTFVPILIELLENPNFGKQLKLDCLVTLGQVFLICGKAATKYLQKLLEVILLCCAASIQLSQSDFSYSEQLKDSIIQTLMCIVHGFNNETGMNNEVIAHFVPNLFQFVRLSTDKKNRPTVTYVKKSMLLLADFGKFYPNIVKPLKSQQFIIDCINTLKTFNKNKQHDHSIRYVQQQLK